MKRITVLAVLLALILGVFMVTGTSAKVPADPPPFSEPPDIILLLLTENEPVGPGQSIQSEWVDVKSFRWFKVYAFMTPYEGVDPEKVTVMVWESATDTPGLGPYFSLAAWNMWAEWPSGTTPHWSMARYLEDGLYSMLRVRVRNSGSVPVNVTLHLLMTRK